MIRAILAILFAVLYLILGIPVLIIEWMIGKFNKRAMDISSLRMVQWAFRVIMFICGVKLTVKGDENVPKDEPVLYICNHKSYFDIIITYSRCPNLTGYISKDTLGKVP
ncbi:MAG: 1-acyl-sn-glycerol-3-phosphate acyltransferase, partial [Lachnospiraceae bacterium]|nr:1-acyl-sn-glycerol-3-phosphate acyltransferase [Lachnospiraceae bacterium]